MKQYAPQASSGTTLDADDAEFYLDPTAILAIKNADTVLRWQHIGQQKFRITNSTRNPLATLQAALECYDSVTIQFTSTTVVGGEAFYFRFNSKDAASSDLC